MMYTRFISTLAALCVFVAAMSGSARAEGPSGQPAGTTKPAEPPKNLKGVYGGVGFGVGLNADASGDDKADDAWRLMVWWRPFTYGSFELGYIDGGNPPGGRTGGGLHLALVPTYPLPMNVDLFAKLGGYFNENSDVAVGLGVAYHFYKNFGIRFDWDRLNVDEHDNIDVLSLALFYHLATQGK